MSTFKFSPTALCFAAVALGISVPSVNADIGNIVFLGDSITQGAGVGNSKTDKSVSYRYALWKCFIDNDVEWKPQGSMEIFVDGSTANSTQTPNYRGSVYDNHSEGHYGWDAAWIVDGNSEGTRPNTGQNTGGLVNWMKGYSATPNTATVLIGVNDLSRGKYSNEDVISNVENIVTTLQSQNSEMAIHVFSLLPSAQSGWSGVSGVPRDIISAYNKDLALSVSEWFTEKSNVQYHDITKGFDPVVHTSDLLHPNTQGTLIVSGNIARALGVGQRTVGLERRGAGMFASQTTFSKADNGVSLHIKTSESAERTVSGDSYWSINSNGNLVLNTSGAGVARDIDFVWGSTETSTHAFTLSLDVKMLEVEGSTTNFLAVWVGNGTSLGMLYIGEDGIYWGGRTASNLLYGQTADAYKDGVMVADFQTLRVVWRGADEDNGIAGGFYVWLNDQLIGEGLSGETTGSAVSTYKNSVVIGDSFSADLETFAEIASISFDANTAWAPSSPIPEPSAFGLLAGIGALALVASRRRRK